jgi:hypothetical protein
LVSIGGENVFGLELDQSVEILELHKERPITIRFRRTKIPEEYVMMTT